MAVPLEFPFGKILVDLYKTHESLQDLYKKGPAAAAGDPSAGSSFHHPRRPFIMQRNQWRHLLDAYSRVFREIEDVLGSILRGPLEALLLAMKSAERSLTQCIAPHIYETPVPGRAMPSFPSNSDGDDAWMTEEPLLAKKELDELQLWLLKDALKHALGNEVQHLHMDDLSTCSIALIEALANYSAPDLNHIPFDPPPPAPTTEKCLSADLDSLVKVIRKVLDDSLVKVIRNVLDQGGSVSSATSNAIVATDYASSSWPTVAQFVLDRLSFTSDSSNDTMMQRLMVDPKQLSDENGYKKRIGKGAFGKVFEKKLFDKHHVAVKVMERWMESGDTDPTSSGLIRLFEKTCGSEEEVRTQVRVYHPNLLPLLCLCSQKLTRNGDMKIGLVSELMHCDLDKLIEEKAPFPLHVAVDIMLKIAKGMEYLHQHKIIHRDLKPQNILISLDSVLSPPNNDSVLSPPNNNLSPPNNDSLLSMPNNNLSVCVKVADFGLSKTIACNSSVVANKHSSNVGTPLYRAPELSKINSQDTPVRYNKMVDVYSFAIVCYQIMRGKDSFKGDELLNLPHKIKEEHYKPSFDNYGSSSCLEALIDMIRSCLNADPFQRPNFSQIAKFLRYMKVCAIRVAGYKEEELENRLKQMCKESRRTMVIAAIEDHVHTMEEGREHQALKVQGILEEDYGQGIVIVCLQGVQGVGKSTLALEIFKNIQHRFISARVKMPPLELEDKDFVRLQTKILEAICINYTGEILDSSHGRNRLLEEFNYNNNGRLGKHELSSLYVRNRLVQEFKVNNPLLAKPILLYIDNLQKPQHLETLLPLANLFPQGLRLLVTTENAKVSDSLKEQGIQKCHSIEVNRLCLHESKALLRKEALIKVKNRDDDIIEYDWQLDILEGRVLGLCHGLPMALKLVGSYIAYSKNGDVENVETWRYVAQQIKEKGDEKDNLYAPLKLSIDALEDSLKTNLFDLVTLNLMNDFLLEDILCMKKNKAVVESILGEERMQSLIDRHLLEDDGEGGIECQDSIRSLVKRMVHDSDGDELRINNDEQLKMHMDHPDDLKKIVCLKAENIADVQQLTRMERLRYAIIEFERAASSPSAEIDFRKLKALRLQRSINRNDHDPVLKLKMIPELRLLIARHDVLDLCQSISATNLQFLLISDCKREIHLDLNLLPSLRHLCIERCLSITHFPSPFGNSSQQFLCTSLQTLQIRDCRHLWKISDTIHKFLTQLTDLSIVDCKYLESLPEDIFKNLGSTLSKLDLSFSKELRKLPEGISVLTSLTELHLSFCTSMEFLPQGMGCLSNLQILDLTQCVYLMNLPDDIFERMGSSLKQLNLHGCKNLEMLPQGISVLTSLTELDLSACSSMEFLPQGMGCLSSLQVLDLTECFNLKNLPDDIFEKMGSSLKQLSLHGCDNLEKLPVGISMLSSLRVLNLSACSSMESLPQGMGCLSSLQVLDLAECFNLKNLPEYIFEKMGSNLNEANLLGCENLETLALSDEISILTSLTKLDLSYCISMKSLPHGMGCLSTLQILDLTRCVNLKNLPDGMFNNMGNNLKQLSLRGCENLEMLPAGISMLTSLRVLNLSECRSMESLPQGMGCLSSLQILDITRCVNLKNLPDGMLETMGSSL